MRGPDFTRLALPVLCLLAMPVAASDPAPGTFAHRGPAAPAREELLRAASAMDDFERAGAPGSQEAGPVWLNYQIGALSTVDAVSVDYDSSSGNQFALLQLSTGNWRLFHSTNAGASWVQRFDVGGTLYPVAEMTTAAGYAYIAYVASTGTYEQVRLRRAVGSTGSIDGVFGYTTIVDVFPRRVEEIAVVTNQINTNDRLYVAILLDDGTVRVWWDVASDGATPNEISPAISGAASGLSMAWNHDGSYLGYFLLLTYVGSDDAVHLYRRGSSGGWDAGQSIATGQSMARTTSVAAFSDVFMVAFQVGDGSGGVDARYRVSYNEGDSWVWGTVGDASADGGSFFTPAVSASSRTGFAYLMQQDTGGLPGADTYWFRERHNLTNTPWSDPVPLNLYDFSYGPTDFQSDFRWMGHGWGMAYVRDDHTAWFSWSRSIRYSGFEVSGLLEWSNWVAGP